MQGFKERCEGIAEVIDYSVGRGFDFIGTFKSVLKFKNLCREKKFDMVVYATPNGALYGSIGSRLAGVPCRVLAQWGMRYVGFDGGKRVIIREIEKISCRFATDIRNVSVKNREIAVADGMYPPEKCKVLGKGGTIGVDLQQYDLTKIPMMRKDIRQKYGISSSDIVYGFVGRICKDKGVHELFQAFKSVRMNQNNAVLMLLGKEDVNAGLDEQLLHEMHNDSHVIFCGAVPNAVVSQYMSAFDILVHPTYREGFGMVLQEAAALQLPTITTDIPGASEAIVDQVTGLLAQKQNVPTLADAMITLTSESLRSEMGKAGRKRIETDFERNMMVNRMCDDYLDIIQRRKLR